MTLDSIGEDHLISKLTQLLHQRSDVIAGPGDDCAVLPLDSTHFLLLKTDAVVEGVHFLPDEAPERVGWKAVARVVSDIAAMGGTPQALVITLALRGDTDLAWAQQLYSGMQRCAAHHACSIVGGETTRAPDGCSQIISVAGTGRVPQDHLILRSTACIGDRIYVTGHLGGSLSGKHLDFFPRLAEARWLASHFRPTAMMDLSDGLAKDLPRLAILSNCGYQIDLASIPCQPGITTNSAIRDGEDYELLFCQLAHRSTDMELAWRTAFPDLPLTCIGEITEHTSAPLDGGWDHFHRSE